MKTIIMAGGRGTRISERFPDIPKPLIPIDGVPVLEREICSLRDQGFTDLILTISHMGDKIRDHFGDGSRLGVRITYFNEETPLGNAGALFLLRGQLTEDFLLLNADAVFDVHMMVVDPDRYVEDFRKSGADIITVHAEACTHLDRVVNHIKETGAKAAVALNPATPLSALEYVLPELDMVLLMTVNPGFGGQKYIPYCTDKIRALRETADRVNPGLSIQVDGGINPDTVRTVLEAGADNLVAGSAVFNGDLAANAEALMNVMKEYH